MPFNTDNQTTPTITKYRRFLSTGMIQLRNGSFSWGHNMTHKCFTAVLSSSSQNGAQLFLCFPPSMLFGVKRLLPDDPHHFMKCKIYVDWRILGTRLYVRNI